MAIIVPVRIRYFNCYEGVAHTLPPDVTDEPRRAGNRRLHAFAVENYPLGAVRFQIENFHAGDNGWRVFNRHSRGLATAAIEARKFAKLDKGRDRL